MTIDIERFRRLLLDRRDELLRESERTRGSRDTVTLDQSRVGRLSRMDAMQAQAMSTALEQRRRQELRRIGAALRRMDDSDYGYCTECDEPISEQRLAFDPAAPLCIECASGAE